MLTPSSILLSILVAAQVPDRDPSAPHHLVHAPVAATQAHHRAHHLLVIPLHASLPARRRAGVRYQHHGPPDYLAHFSDLDPLGFDLSDSVKRERPLCAVVSWQHPSHAAEERALYSPCVLYFVVLSLPALVLRYIRSSREGADVVARRSFARSDPACQCSESRLCTVVT